MGEYTTMDITNNYAANREKIIRKARSDYGLRRNARQRDGDSVGREL